MLPRKSRLPMSNPLWRNHPDEVLGQMAPIGHKHINMRGTLKFELAQYASSLLRQGHIINNERLS